jgi:hypothetical protein
MGLNLFGNELTGTPPTLSPGLGFFLSMEDPKKKKIAFYRTSRTRFAVLFLAVFFYSLGRIPAEFGVLGNLRELSLSMNQLTGTPSLPLFP